MNEQTERPNWGNFSGRSRKGQINRKYEKLEDLANLTSRLIPVIITVTKTVWHQYQDQQID